MRGIMKLYYSFITRFKSLRIFFLAYIPSVLRLLVRDMCISHVVCAGVESFSNNI